MKSAHFSSMVFAMVFGYLSMSCVASVHSAPSVTAIPRRAATVPSSPSVQIHVDPVEAGQVSPPILNAPPVAEASPLAEVSPEVEVPSVAEEFPEVEVPPVAEELSGPLTLETLRAIAGPLGAPYGRAPRARSVIRLEIELILRLSRVFRPDFSRSDMASRRYRLALLYEELTRSARADLHALYGRLTALRAMMPSEADQPQ